jgi:hypothetical protein
METRANAGDAMLVESVAGGLVRVTIDGGAGLITATTMPAARASALGQDLTRAAWESIQRAQAAAAKAGPAQAAAAPAAPAKAAASRSAARPK